MKLNGNKKYYLILLALNLIFSLSCSYRIPYSIQQGDYTQITLKAFSISYYSDYQFFKPTITDAILARSLLSRAKLIPVIKKNNIIYTAKTKISPYYKHFLLRFNNPLIECAAEKYFKVADSISAVYYYTLNVKKEYYIFIHYQIKVSDNTIIDSTTSKKEFLFIINSLKKNHYHD